MPELRNMHNLISWGAAKDLQVPGRNITGLYGMYSNPYLFIYKCHVNFAT